MRKKTFKIVFKNGFNPVLGSILGLPPLINISKKNSVFKPQYIGNIYNPKHFQDKSHE